MLKNKIFIIGLPRTSTTSLCTTMLELGFTTAHTAYTKQAINEAQALADSPIFCDFKHLDKYYPNSKFIYLERDLTFWLPSIRQLLKRMLVNLQRSDGGFNIHIKRSFQTIFDGLNEARLEQDSFLQSCYQNHKTSVLNYFKKRPEDLLLINLSQEGDFKRLLHFLDIDASKSQIKHFPHINKAGKVTAWKQIKHPLKIESTRAGKIDKILYPDMT